jgi:adenine-specific DNA-methyltransferase
MNPAYDEDGITLYHGDAATILPTLPATHARLVLTDPPYFASLRVAEWQATFGSDPAAYLAWLGTVIDQADRILEPAGMLAMFTSPRMALGVHLEIARRMAVTNEITWAKPPARLGTADRTRLRSFWPNSERIILAERTRHEPGLLEPTREYEIHQDPYTDVRARLIALRDAAGLTNRDVDAALGTAGMAGHYYGASQWELPHEAAWATIAGLLTERGIEPPQYRHLARTFNPPTGNKALAGDVWSFAPVPPAHRHAEHPTEKPAALIAHLMLALTNPGDLVIDPFSGTGTTLRVAQDHGRRAIGIEINPRYCDATIRRLAQRTLPL